MNKIHMKPIQLIRLARMIFIVCGLIISKHGTKAQNLTTSKNHVVTRSAKVAGIKSVEDMVEENQSEVRVVVNYTDRLGRPDQQIVIGASPNGKDIVSFHQYQETSGLETKNYLPYVSASATNEGAYIPSASTDQANFYLSASHIDHDTAPWSEVEIERSPFKRVLKSGGLGKGYQLADSYYTSTDFKLNETTDKVLEWTTNDQGDLHLEANVYFPSESLIKSTVKGPEYEEGNNNHQTITFTNYKGQKILIRHFNDTEQFDTYYVYDDFGRLIYVVPPEAVRVGQLPVVEYYDPNQLNIFTSSQAFPATSPTNTVYYVAKNKSVALNEGLVLEEGFDIGMIPENGVVTGYEPVPDIDQYLFKNKYDNKGQLVIKKVPGAEEIHYIYDISGRLILSQDGKQRTNEEWTFTKYDQHDRPILTGVVTDERNRTTLQLYLNTEIVEGKRFESRGSVIHGYTDNVWPKGVNADDYLVVSYYDDYAFIDGNWTGFAHDTNNGINDEASLLMPRGQETGGKIRVLSSSSTQWLKSVKYYDEDLQLIQGISDHHRGNLEKVYTQYNWLGEVVKTRFTHKVNASKTLTIDERYVYDDGGRLLEQYHSTDNEPEILIASMSYNEMDELIEKNLHKQSDDTYVQSVDYRYNIRGQLININKADGGVHTGDTDDNPDRFGINLYYESSPSGLTFESDNPSNLAGTTWSHPDMETDQRAYGYSYDGANRLTGAEYNEKDGGVWGTKKNHFNVSDITYDRNGNIKTLSRKHNNTLVDDLEYSYDGNKLWTIDDVTNEDEGFKDGAEGAEEYDFDENGNMIRDDNKLITSISYNMLNKPEIITFSNGDHIDYLYDAAGTRLRMSVTTGSDTFVTDYSSRLIYEEDELTLIPMPQGRIVVEKVADDYNYDYQYHLTDHLGNTRSTVAPLVRVYKATMESENAGVEDNQFLNLAAYRNLDAANAKYGDESARLNADDDKMIGPAKALKLYAGDVVDLKVFAKYQSTANSTQATTSVMLFDALAAAYGIGGSGELFTAFQGQFGAASLFVQTQNEVPAAFMNYIFYDENYENPQFGHVQVSSAAESDFETLTLSVTAPADGYMFTYLSNESSLDVDVYFDNYQVTHTSSASVLQADDYYPFGLPITGNKYEEPGNKNNRFLYQGKEWQTALALNLYDFHARQYDPATGRFLSSDPQNQFASGYVGMGNQPTVGVDPDGEFAWIPFVIGAVINVIANRDRIDNVGEFLSYAVVGGVSASIGSGVSGANIVFANTLALASASTFNSAGNYIVNGGEGNIYTSFGGVSMNWSQGDFGYLGEKGNSTLENIGYGLGALANVADINKVINSTDATLYTEKNDAISHSAIVDDKTGSPLMSYGPADDKIGGTPPSIKDRIPAAKPALREAGGYKKFGLAIRKSKSDFHVYTDLPVDVTVNKHTVGLVRSLGKVLPYQGCTVNCTNMASLSLWLNGIPNIGIHPYFLYASTWAYSNGIRADLFSYHLQNHK
ncbi:MAG: DUF6443 domain-containing protein [Reichenbachiella sp.]|uniref:DUF6443 domain-containing protein n=1 Tax=Reichenbachiella sp. TaxID=2184521 RepID=UPI003263A619